MTIECYNDQCQFHSTHTAPEDGPFCYEEACRNRTYNGKGAVVHRLKIDPEPASHVIREIKTFEVRKNDRDFQVGDTLMLSETRYSALAMRQGQPLEYTGRQIEAQVTYILDGTTFPEALQEDYVILAIKVIDTCVNLKSGGNKRGN